MGCVGSSIVHGMTAVRMRMDTACEPPSAEQPIAGTGLGWLYFMGLHSNIRYNAVNAAEDIMDARCVSSSHMYMCLEPGAIKCIELCFAGQKRCGKDMLQAGGHAAGWLATVLPLPSGDTARWHRAALHGAGPVLQCSSWGSMQC